MKLSRKMVRRIAAALLLLAILFLVDASRPPEKQFSARSAIAAIHVYQAHLRPLTEGYTRCRLQPTCSCFAVATLEKEGIWGSFAIGERLIACERAPLPERRLLARGPLVSSSPGTGARLAAWQGPRPDYTAACGGCLAATGFLFALVIGSLALGIALLVFVAKDAKNRGLESPVLWMILVLFTHVLGLVIYLLSRPGGNLVQCEHCRNQKLQYARLCPHCGNVDSRSAVSTGG
jgi:putative component of membrane protein insertase Oxa1/YidC/SpoIIIJ protein YidD